MYMYSMYIHPYTHIGLLHIWTRIARQVYNRQIWYQCRKQSVIPFPEYTYTASWLNCYMKIKPATALHIDSYAWFWLHCYVTLPCLVMESQPYLGPSVLHIHHFLIDDACITQTHSAFMRTAIISCSSQELPFLILH